MSQVRVMQYVNQFFAGKGSEDKADVPVGSCEGPVGPGKRLQAHLGDKLEIVVTAYCGDDYFAAHRDEALASILQIARDSNVKIVVAGPAFASGRYGHACVEVCHGASTSLGLNCVTGMHLENPGMAAYRQYKDRRVFACPTAEAVSCMEDALKEMACLVSKLAAGSAIGPPSIEGYIPRGFRRDEVASKSGAARAIDMLVDKLAGHPFSTEICIYDHLEAIPATPRIANLKDTCLALVTTSGVVAQGNSGGLRGYANTQWRKYSIDKLDSMQDASWDVLHGGYNTQFMQQNPNYGVPLDVCRELERERAFARLYPYFYVTPGSRGHISVMHRLGREMFLDLKANGVDAVLLVAT